MIWEELSGFQKPDSSVEGSSILMKLAVVTPTPEVEVSFPFALLAGTFTERLDKAAQLGCDGLELITVRPNELNADQIRTQTAQAGLEVAAIGSGAIYMVDRLTLLAADPEISRQAFARLNALIEFAAAVEAPLVTIGGFRGRLEWAGGGPVARQKLIDILGEAAEKAAVQGIRIVLEPLNHYETDIVRHTDDGLALIKDVGYENLGLLLDTFHMNIDEPSLYDCFRQAAEAGRMWHVHLGDSNRLPPGQGHIDFAGIVSTLQEVGYQDYLSAELLPRPDPDAAAKATIEYMRQFVPEQS